MNTLIKDNFTIDLRNIVVADTVPFLMGTISRVKEILPYNLSSPVVEEILKNTGVKCQFYRIETPVGLLKVMHYDLPQAVEKIHSIVKASKRISKCYYTHNLVNQKFKITRKA